MSEEKVVLSEENIKLLVSLATHGCEKEVQKDPNFALALLLRRMKENISSPVVSVLLNSLEPNALEYARKELARNKAA